MKKIVFLSVCVTVLLSCNSKSQALDKQKSETAIKKEMEKKQKEQYDADIIKLNKVLLSMSDRFKADFPNGDPKEFLDDLYKVLEAEKSFSSDDISFYYLIDKKHNIGADYVPFNLKKLVQNQYYNISRNDLSLRPDVEEALVKMAQASKQDGITLLVSSSYRSYEYQKNLFKRWVSIDGLEEAERESAREGTSQHQLGTAIDFGTIDASFINTAQGKWLNEHAWEYGWSLSFPKGYEDVTGFKYECWHFRYIGIEACKFQRKWFNDVQQYMLEFIDAWKNS